MPQLAWNDLDFLECLEVLPEVDEFFVSHTYSVVKESLQLDVTIWQLESVVQVSMSRHGADESLWGFACFVRGTARRVNDTRGESLELRDCIVAPSRFCYMQAGDPFDRQRFSVGVAVVLAIKPDLRVEIIPNPDS